MKGRPRKLSCEKVLYFATSNPAKVKEVEAILHGYPLVVRQVDAKGREIQSDSLQEIAEESACRAAEETQLPVFVEDAGLFIGHLEGFPGPYASYVYRTIGVEGILVLMQNVPNRRAVFYSVVAFCVPGNKPQSFTGKVEGIITNSARGGGFGFDPIFEPKGGDNKTFGEMSLQEKNLCSHRTKAVRKLAEWYLVSDTHNTL